MIENGATTLWELWQLRQGPSMNSHNHPMFGSVGSWLYKALAGINQAAGSGFEKIRIAPQMVRDLWHASASVQIYMGPVLSSWSRNRRKSPARSPRSRSRPRPRSSCRGSILRTQSGKESGKTVWVPRISVRGSGVQKNRGETEHASVIEIGSETVLLRVDGRLIKKSGRNYSGSAFLFRASVPESGEDEPAGRCRQEKRT